MTKKAIRDRLAVRLHCHLRDLLAARQAAKQRHIAYSEITVATGIDPSTISDWVRNRVKRYDADKLAAFCAYFGCTVGELLEYRPPRRGRRPRRK
jgi:DNA-binding Xre family transcriptional regulator